MHKLASTKISGTNVTFQEQIQANTYSTDPYYVMIVRWRTNNKCDVHEEMSLQEARYFWNELVVKFKYARAM